jgi:DNA primase
MAMSNIDFKAFNRALNYKDVARVLGIDTIGNKALCPLHREKTPSFVFYPDHWHCFGCRESGDYIALTAKLLCVNNADAYEWLNKTLSMGFPSTKDVRIKPSYRKKQQVNYEEWLRSAKFIVADYIRMFRSLDDTIYKDKADIAGAELLHDKLLESNDPQEAFTLYGSEVAKIGNKVERYRQLKTIQQLFD